MRDGRPSVVLLKICPILALGQRQDDRVTLILKLIMFRQGVRDHCRRLQYYKSFDAQCNPAVSLWRMVDYLRA